MVRNSLIRLSVSVFAVIAISNLASATELTFDYPDFPESGYWAGDASQSIDVGGTTYTLQGAGRTFGVARGATADDAWRGSFAFTGGGVTGEGSQAELTLNDGTNDISFLLKSIDMENLPNDASLVGMLAGVEQFNIMLDQGFGNATDGMPTYDHASYPALNTEIDQLIFRQVSNDWDNRFDNVVIETDLSASSMLGDFDNDGDVDLDDLDQYNSNLDITVAANPGLAALDLDGNGTINAADFSLHYETLVETSNGGIGTAAGDINLDGVVDVLGDAFILVANLNNAATSWSQGDINADGIVNVLGDAFALVGNLGADNGGGS